MKFRCRMVDTGAMRDFTNIINSISRISKNCVLRLTPNELCFNIGDEHIPVLWVVLLQEYFFVDYVMNGLSEQDNEIYLEFDATMFAGSLNGLKAMARSAKIKLTNKYQPCLTFEIDLSSLSINSRECVHDVPVKVISRKEWPEYKMPDIPEFDISLEVPQLRHLRHIVGKMNNMSTELSMIANKNGTLTIKIEVNYATVSTYFKNLEVFEVGAKGENDDVTATVSIKKFASFLNWDILHPDKVACNLLHEKMVKLTLDVGDHVKMHFFMPAIIS
ncbi:hypothetical protein PUN28_007331 [Cardiocondyla obscurior]|uniref:Checkpoint protein n=2 Tax=Cardiocondyla obscurior TaxID=286306 RepID=A0AAW2G6F1_9HYME